MKTDGVFSVNTTRIDFKKYGKPIYIYILSDIHHDSPNHDRKKFIDFCKEGKDIGAYLIGVGDYLDIMSTSERSSMKRAEFHEQTTISFDKFIESRVEELSVTLNKYFKGKILGFGGGNHYYNLSYGMTSDQLLCYKLNTIYLGVCSLLRLQLCYTGSKVSHKVDFCLHHGLGGGRTSGSSINKLQTMANFFSADVMLMGHDHNRAVDYINRLEISNLGSLYNRRIMLARTGSFLKSYNTNVPSYAVSAMYPPSDLGGLKIKITPMRVSKGSRKRVDRRWIDIEAQL